MSEQERIARGHQAASELVLTAEAFEQVEQAIVARLAATPITQPEVVLRLHAALQNLDAVRRVLKNIVSDGQMAEHALSAEMGRPN